MFEKPEAIRRQAECATMLVAISKLLLDAEPREFAAWLRAVADDIEKQDGPTPEQILADRFEDEALALQN